MDEDLKNEKLNKIDFELDHKTWRSLNTRVLIDIPNRISSLEERVEKLEKTNTSSNVKAITDLLWWFGFFGAYTYILTRKN